MKRFYYLAAIAFAAISCQNKDNLDKNLLPKEQMVFEASIAVTRTVLNELTPEWSKGETIYLFNSTEKELYTAQNESQAPTANFKGNALSGNVFMAVSPATAVSTNTKANPSSKTITKVTIPTKQQPIVDSYDPKAMISVAYTEDNRLEFNNAVTLLKFTVGSTGVNKVTFAGWGGENMSGNCDVVLTDDGAEIQNATMTYVELSGTFTKNKTYYAVVAPGAYSKGLLCEFNEAKVQVTESAIELKPNTIVDLGTISFSGVNLRGGFNSWKEYQMAKCGDWYAAYGVQVMKTESGQDAGFKFEKGNTWYGGSSNKALYTEHNIGGSNITITGDSSFDTYLNASFDVFVSKDFKKYKIRIHGERETRDVTLTVKKGNNNWSKIYAYGWYGAGNSSEQKFWGNWPGTEITSTMTIKIPKERFGTAIKFIINNGSGSQTEDLCLYVTGDHTHNL